MTMPDRLTRALGRLGSALDNLEASAMRRAQADAARANLEDELAVMGDDRARLAVELDGALARSKAVIAANDDVARRLEAVTGLVRAALDDIEGQGDAAPGPGPSRLSPDAAP